MADGIGFIVKELTESAPIFDGLVKDEDYRPDMIRNHTYECFNDAFRYFVDRYGVHKEWYPDYILKNEENEVVIRLMHQGDCNNTRYRTTLSITKTFYCRKEEGG